MDNSERHSYALQPLVAAVRASHCEQLSYNSGSIGAPSDLDSSSAANPFHVHVRDLIVENPLGEGYTEIDEILGGIGFGLLQEVQLHP
jgi:hypothetical protein